MHRFSWRGPGRGWGGEGGGSASARLRAFLPPSPPPPLRPLPPSVAATAAYLSTWLLRISGGFQAISGAGLGREASRKLPTPPRSRQVNEKFKPRRKLLWSAASAHSPAKQNALLRDRRFRYYPQSRKHGQPLYRIYLTMFIFVLH